MSPGTITPATLCNPPRILVPLRSGAPIPPCPSSSMARTPSPIQSPARSNFSGWSSEQGNQPMKTKIIPENRNWPPEWDFEQEATERTEIQREKSLFPSLTSVQICPPFIRIMSSFESALRSLCCLLFKPSRLRPALCALCVVLWQSALAEVRYVDVNSTNATPPYTNWATAATNIQDAVDAAVAGDEIVVTNGTYATGTRLAGTDNTPNRVAVDKPLKLRSVNGPQFTAIYGDTSSLTPIRC